MKRRTFIIGVVSTMIFVLGVIFKYFLIAGAEMLMLIGMLFYILGFILLLFIDKVSIESRRSARISLFFLLLAVILSSVYGLFKVLSWGEAPI
jgi:hypothetical protein